MPLTKFLSCIKCLAVASGVAVAAGVAFIYSGFYPVGADDRHTALTFWALETLRERSIARASAGIEVPANMGTPERLLAGGADYNDMCAGCHLKPGRTESDFTLGLYPAPPNLTQVAPGHGDLEAQARQRFWTIKHGIEASGMPAWGPGHDDERIWNMVGFLRRLPDLSSEQYQILTARGSTDSGHH